MSVYLLALFFVARFRFSICSATSHSKLETFHEDKMKSVLKVEDDQISTISISSASAEVDLPVQSITESPIKQPLHSATIPCIQCQSPLQGGKIAPYLLDCGHVICASCIVDARPLDDSSIEDQLLPPTLLKCAECGSMSSLPLTKHYALIRAFIKQQAGDAADIGEPS